MTEAEIADTFGNAYRNWKHEMIEMSFWVGQFHVKNPRELRRHCDRMHAALDYPNSEPPKEAKRVKRVLPHQL